MAQKMTVTGNSQDGAVTGVHKGVDEEPEVILTGILQSKVTFSHNEI